MQMMYDIIVKELKYMNLENAHPRDYMDFYCLGNRDELQTEEISSADDSATASEKFRRFMIYVGMIVDDEYVLMGSANINQRSLDGSRDMEIAMDARLSTSPHLG
uniref:phospholipase D n=1 Tax=Kalanchoe fedtschenkoi TaxID=63787 RepID=A0A7N0T073_KALFE